MDDTLYLERDFAFSGYEFLDKYIQEKFQKKGFSSIAKNIFENGDRRQVFNRTLEELEITFSEELIKELVSEYRQHIPKIELLNDVNEVLDDLQGKFGLGLITDGFKESQRNKIKSLNLESILDHIIVTDEFGRDCWKPSQFAFLKMMDLFGGRPEEFVYIGDNESKDFIAPNQLGWMTVKIKRPEGVHFEKHAKSKEEEARYCIGDLRQLIEVLS